ncbi:MAG TPA: DUF4142 domain-containing protein [Longimicrobium sp.]|nr:DUF4142 domain-containing protein [Longimicrobium sp.]
MEKGRDFLRAQVSNAVMQHRTLVDNLEDHAATGKDPAYQQLCQRWLPKMQQHQRMLEEYRATLGEPAGEGVKGVIGSLLGKARDAVDALREDDFLSVVADIVTIRQSQDSFATFAAVGERIGQPRMSEIGRHCEPDHAQMAADFNRHVQELFVRNAQAAA